ncbi:MAG: DUF3524 domain-containing protein [Thermodesulfobacteriota bacterium]|nr:DUF3524 domain-containing protein [Thermodesulfobacteriota bacterium]
MEIALLEPFFTGSHASWAQGYAERSRHQVSIFGLKGHHWKWRMHGGAVSLAREFLAADYRPDLLLVTDMLDLTTFLALTRKLTANISTAIYFHENQLTYPWSPTDSDPQQQRDIHYGFINYTSALAADAVLFNSDYHRQSFLQKLPGFLKAFPDYNEVETAQKIIDQSRTLPLGLDLKKFDKYRPGSGAAAGQPPLILWNHRWEYDKNPEEFFRALFVLQEQNIDFELAVLGESYRKVPKIFAEAKQKLSDRIVHWGYAQNFSDYAAWLWRADILPVTSIHDFFGISVVQSIYCNGFPLLPKRLAYPEHITTDYCERCFYTDFDDLVPRLRSACLNIKSLRQEKLQSMVDHYDWGKMVAIYDDLLEDVVVRGCPRIEETTAK